MDITIKLLNDWTEQDPFSTYKNCHFKASVFKTQQLLKAELKRIEARNVVLHTQHSPNQLRKDGWVKTDRAPANGPGVILEFEKPSGADIIKLRFPCRTFDKWEDNLRAIALALEALRTIDRYGVTTGAQYAGYKALPPAEQGTEGQTPEQAAEFVAKAAGMPDAGHQILVNDVFADLAYKTAAKKLHPDLGGNEREFQKL
jgi:hypothetical protein